MATKSLLMEMSETSPVASPHTPAAGVSLSGGSRPAPDDVVVALLDGSERDSVVDGARPPQHQGASDTAARAHVRSAEAPVRQRRRTLCFVSSKCLPPGR